MKHSRAPQPITHSVNWPHRLMTVLFPYLLALALLAVTSLIVPFGAGSQTGQRKRVIEETPYPHAPVQIVGVTNRRYHIKFKESFLDDDDWIKGLEVEVINKSGKTVTHVGIDLLFERPRDQVGEPPTFFPLNYGLNPFRLNPEDPIPTSKIRTIRPGEKTSITLSDLEYEDLKALLRDTRYFNGIEKIKMFVTTIGFDDGTAWGGTFYIRDPNAPNGWSPREKPPGSTKKGAAFPFLRLSYHHPRTWKSDIASWPTSVPLQGAQCGQAIVSSLSCNQLPGCRYDLAVSFNDWNQGPDYVVNGFAQCFFTSNGVKYGCGSSPLVPRRVPCPNPSPSPSPTPTPPSCRLTGDFCVSGSQCCSGLCDEFNTCNTCSPCDGGCGEGIYQPLKESSETPSITSPGTCCSDYERLSCLQGGGEWYESQCTCYSPIVIDLAGNGFNLTSAGDGVMFDIPGGGVPEQVSWTAADSDDAWLVLDRNGNGLIDDGKELFGSSTPQHFVSPGESKNGFRALAVFDEIEHGGNSDGQIDRRDSVFSHLKLWQDRNHNGFSEGEELQNLWASVLRVIELNYKESRRKDENGNWFRYRVRVRDERGAQAGRWAWDVYLQKPH